MVILAIIMHHVQITMVHTLASVTVVTPIPQLVSKLDFNGTFIVDCSVDNGGCSDGCEIPVGLNMWSVLDYTP